MVLWLLFIRKVNFFAKVFWQKCIDVILNSELGEGGDKNFDINASVIIWLLLSSKVLSTNQWAWILAYLYISTSSFGCSFFFWLVKKQMYNIAPVNSIHRHSIFWSFVATKQRRAVNFFLNACYNIHFVSMFLGSVAWSFQSAENLDLFCFAPPAL